MAPTVLQQYLPLIQLLNSSIRTGIDLPPVTILSLIARLRTLPTALVRRTSQTRASATHPPASEHRILTSTSRHRPPTRPSTSISSTSTVVPVLTSPTLSLSLRSSNGRHAQAHRAMLYAGCRQADGLTYPGPSKGVDENQPLECCDTSAARAPFLWNEDALIEDRFRH